MDPVERGKILLKKIVSKNNCKKGTHKKLTSSLQPLLSADVGMGRKWEVLPTSAMGLSSDGSRWGRVRS
jgi:hypothetical protein